MAKIRFSCAALRLNIVFFGGVILWTVLFLPFGFLAWCWQVIVRGITSHIAIRNLIQWYGIRCAALLASQTAVEVIDNNSSLPRPCIIVSNHQSFFDPYCIGFFNVFAPTFVVRSWPFRIPLYGRIMRRAKYINIDDINKEVLLRKAKDIIDEGATLVVFPEGTRSTSGALGRFHPGAFKLAMEHNTPIVPMCIDGSGRVFPRGSRLGKPAPISVTLLPPIYPAQFSAYGELAHRHLQKHVKLAMENTLQGTPLPPL